MTKVVRTVTEWRAIRSSLTSAGQTVGFVPTMGALHEGHLALVAESRKRDAITVVSIFVNPTQFNDLKDLDAYPRTEAEDLSMLQAAGVNFLFAPSEQEMYPAGYSYRVSEATDESRVLCGAHRPGHFDGMLTVVMKLFQIIHPNRAYFGEKDLQQLKLVQGMVREFFLPIEVVAIPTVRETDGLAMSSRNRRLTASEREIATRFPKILRSAPSSEEAHRALESEGFRVDYVEERWGRRLAAVHLGKVRLIDHV